MAYQQGLTDGEQWPGRHLTLVHPCISHIQQLIGLHKRVCLIQIFIFPPLFNVLLWRRPIAVVAGGLFWCLFFSSIAYRKFLNQWSATTGPRPGAGPWGVRHRAVSFSRLNALKHFCNDRRNYFRTFYEKERIIVQLLSHKSWFHLRVLIFAVKF